MKIVFVFAVVVAAAIPSSGQNTELEIPESCKKLGICEDIPNYPKDLVDDLLMSFPDKSIFQVDALGDEIGQRVGPEDENIELCSSHERIVYPKAGLDAVGKWHVVLNAEENPVQGFKVEICNDEPSSCSPIAYIQPGYEARCKQKFAYRTMAVLKDEVIVKKSLKVPSCCSCVAKLV